jgi:transcriptional regulator with XRE-family HTH domain
MEYLETLGQVLREIRVAAGLSREDCSQVLNRDHLAKVEQGRQAITVLKLKGLCECLGVPQSLVLVVVESRLAEVELLSYRKSQDEEFNRHLTEGKLSNDVNLAARQGVRGKRAQDNSKAVQALQVQGYTKAEIIRELSLSRSTIDRYWLKSSSYLPDSTS